MNDDILKKISSPLTAMDLATKMAKVPDNSLSAMTQAIKISKSWHTHNDLPMGIDILSGVDKAMSKVFVNPLEENPIFSKFHEQNTAFYKAVIEPTWFNPVMSAFDSINKLSWNTDFMDGMKKSPMQQILSSIPNENYGMPPHITEFLTMDWREKYPALFFDTKAIFYSNEFSKFNENLKKISDMIGIEHIENIIDGSIASLQLDNDNDDVLQPSLEKVYRLTNSAFEQVIEGKDAAIVFQKLLKRLEKFLDNKYVLNIISSVAGAIMVLMLQPYLPIKTTTEKIEQVQQPKVKSVRKSNDAKEVVKKLIAEMEIGVKMKPIKSYCDFTHIKIGSEINVIDYYTKWAKVHFINENGIPQIGYCRIDELKKSAE